MSDNARMQVQMPDGTVVDAPVGTTKAELQARWERHQLTALRSQAEQELEAGKETYRTQKTDKPFREAQGKLERIDDEITARESRIAREEAMRGGFWDKAGYYTKQAASAVGRGLAAIPALAAEAGRATGAGGFESGSALRDSQRIGLQPTTTGEKYAARTVEGVASAVGPGIVAAPVRTAIAGGGSGFGSEAAAQSLGDTPLNRLLGGLAGGGLVSVVSAPKTTRKELAAETLRDARPEDLVKGRQLMQDALDEGVTLNLSQAMPRASNIDKTVDILAQNQFGKNVVHQLREQPRQVAFGMETQAAKLPGAVREPQIVANNSQEASEAAIRQGFDLASKAWQKAAPQGSTVPQSAVAALDNELAALAKRYPNTSGAALIEEARAALRVPKQPAPSGPQLVGPNGQPLNPPPAAPKYLEDALQLKGALEDVLSTFGSRKLNTSGLDATNLRRAQEVRESFRSVIDNHAPNLSAANAAYAQVMDDVVNPMKKSVVGRVAQRGGVDDAIEAVKTKVFAVLEAGTTPGAKSSEILTLERAMRKSNPEAFQDAVKTWLATKLSKAAGQEGGRVNESVAANIERVLMGDEVKSQGFKDMLVGLARSQGLPDNALLPGMQNFLKIVGAASRRPGNVTGTTPQQLERTSRSRIFGGIGNFSAIQPVRQPFKAVDDWLNRDAYSFMDRLLTSPGGVDTLMKLGKQPVMSNAAAETLATFVATAANATNPGQRQGQ